ncbi:MAG: asparaginase [Planctomycetes bacterium]|nr:asparaginase [Planctomycetota bacterium]
MLECSGMLPDRSPVPLVARTRGEHVECIHRGWAVLWEDGREWAAGDASTPVFTRSCTKAFQALAFLVSGAADRYGCTAAELALACASHNGSPEHVALAARMLARAGLDGGALRCGASAPYGEEDHKLFLARGGAPDALIHNCSGKHAAFLLTQSYLGGAPERYLDRQSPLQQLVFECVADVLELPRAELGAFVDGCSAPTFRMPLRNLAIGFARLANPELAPARYAPHLARLRDAMCEYPQFHSGIGRLCHALIRASGGKVIPKNGAEGVYAFGVRGRRSGFAMKVEDGASRGHDLAVVSMARALGAIGAGPQAAELAPFEECTLRNAAGAEIGKQQLLIALPGAGRP